MVRNAIAIDFSFSAYCCWSDRRFVVIIGIVYIFLQCTSRAVERRTRTRCTCTFCYQLLSMPTAAPFLFSHFSFTVALHPCFHCMHARARAHTLTKRMASHSFYLSFALEPTVLHSYWHFTISTMAACIFGIVVVITASQNRRFGCAPISHYYYCYYFKKNCISFFLSANLLPPFE